MENLPTAEEFALSDNWEKVIDHVTITRMIGFARMHVEVALKAAADDVSEEHNDALRTCILNSYPLTNIK